MQRFSELYLAVILVTSFFATSVSLYYSEILGFPPCDLCWYQRIFMYPIVIISLIGIIGKDSSASKYILGLAIPGGGIALYQYLLQKGIISSLISFCSLDNPCAKIQVEYFGFVTIPLLSLIAFLLIIGVCLVMPIMRNNAH